MACPFQLARTGERVTIDKSALDAVNRFAVDVKLKLIGCPVPIRTGLEAAVTLPVRERFWPWRVQCTRGDQKAHLATWFTWQG